MKSSVIRGLLLGLGSEIVVAMLLWAGLAIAGIGPMEHFPWFGACLFPPLLMIRYFVKKDSDLVLVKTLITILFVTTITYLFFVLRYNGTAII